MADSSANNANTEKFEGYETDLKLVQADLNQKLDRIPELSGEQRKAAISEAERPLAEAKDLLFSMRMEKASVPVASRNALNQRMRNYEHDVDKARIKLDSLKTDRAALFGSRYQDDPAGDEQLEQRQQLLSGTERLTRTSERLKDTMRTANDTENIGAGVLSNLAEQRATIVNTHDVLLESEGYTDRSIKTLRGMARRMATNRVITIAIITILIILIIAVIVSKFR